MMRWRRKYHPPREVQAYLGDVPDGLEPARQSYQTRGDVPRWLERGIGGIVAIAAVAVLSALILAAIILALMVAAKPSLAADETAVRRDCRLDALLQCPKEAARCLLKEDAVCRYAIIGCMRANKSKLTAACARHLR